MTTPHQQLAALLKENWPPDLTPHHQLSLLSAITGQRLTLVRVDLRNLTVTATPIAPMQLDPETESAPSTSASTLTSHELPLLPQTHHPRPP